MLEIKLESTRYAKLDGGHGSHLTLDESKSEISRRYGLGRILFYLGSECLTSQVASSAEGRAACKIRARVNSICLYPQKRSVPMLSARKLLQQ